jgi:hypothetical protein
MDRTAKAYPNLNKLPISLDSPVRELVTADERFLGLVIEQMAPL